MLGTDANGQVEDHTKYLTAVYESNIYTPTFYLALDKDAWQHFGKILRSTDTFSSDNEAYTGFQIAATPFDIDPSIEPAWWQYYIKYNADVFNSLGLLTSVNYYYNQDSNEAAHSVWPQNSKTILAELIFPDNFLVNTKVGDLGDKTDFGQANRFHLYCHAVSYKLPTCVNANEQIYYGSAIISEARAPYRRYEISYTGCLPTADFMTTSMEGILKVRLLDYTPDLSGYAGISQRTLQAANNAAESIASSAVQSCIKTVKVGSTSYAPSNGTVTLPAYPSYSIATSSKLGLVKSSTNQISFGIDYEAQIDSATGIIKTRVARNTYPVFLHSHGSPNYSGSYCLGIFKTSSSGTNEKLTTLVGDSVAGTLYHIYGLETKEYGMLSIQKRDTTFYTDYDCFLITSGDQGYWGKSYLTLTVFVPRNETYYLWGRNVSGVYANYCKATLTS